MAEQENGYCKDECPHVARKHRSLSKDGTTPENVTSFPALEHWALGSLAHAFANPTIS